jgi:hypothetical protein
MKNLYNCYENSGIPVDIADIVTIGRNNILGLTPV